MHGQRSEPAEVWTHDGRPVRFGWRGRLYTVLAVLERPAGQHDGARMRCWKVRASPGISVPADVYRLCQDAESGRWTLSRDSG